MTQLRTRTRVKNDYIPLGSMGTTGYQTYYYGTTPQSQEICIDVLHPDWPPHGKTRRDVGGPFTKKTVGYYVTPSAPLVKTVGLSWCNTSFIPQGFPTYPAMPGFKGGWDAGLEVDGTAGWNKHRPGKPQASVGQFLGELTYLPTYPLRAILRARNRLDKFRQIGSEYLNVQFGWLPFVNDLKDIWSLSQTLPAHIAQLRRDNGKTVRRGGKVRTEDLGSTVTSVTTIAPHYPTLVTQLAGTHTGTIKTITKETEDAWFSAAFRYYIADVETVAFENRATLALFGLNPSPSLLWELLPWSWLIDWGANVGDVLSNMSTGAAENLVADYAYVMRHRKWSMRTVASRRYHVNGSWLSLSCEGERRHEQKFRVAASPYGFGLVPGDLSGRQNLILGALGISRNW